MAGRTFRPNTTQVPNEILDFIMADLSDAEFKVLMYIVRRTFGFQKDGDHISLSQLVTGITRRDGSLLDRGTGMSKPAVIRGIKGLEQRGIITVRRDSPHEAGRRTYDTSFYSLNLGTLDSASVENIGGSNVALPSRNGASPGAVTLVTPEGVTQSNQQNPDQKQEPKEDTEGVKRRLTDLYRLLPQTEWERATVALHRGDPSPATLRARVEAAIAAAKARR